MNPTRLSDVISGHAKRGGLGIGMYLVPGFPDWGTSIEALDLCLSHGVDFIEFPAMAEPRWSPRTGPMLVRALRQAEPYSEAMATEWLLRAPVRVAVAYGSAWPTPGVWKAPLPLRTGVSGYLFESDPPDLAPYAKAAAEDGAVIIPAVDATVVDLSEDDRRLLSLGGGFVYASLGPETGKRAASPADLKRKREQIRSVRSDLPVCAAFGISRAADVEELRSGGACDGIIIGSAALARLDEGMAAFSTWLTEIVTAARQP
ncbi:tryptophan synthase subunit alpha [Actinomadura barringtoniae]|uniref:tryptophan synthase n=1 Tax=Actinomadura barringtoniae TaxID=1427535 RepID=A0A939TAV9_9ACTN|nr:tryptophan synthase subunit alpha [Actinomadura barringtoniae]MBO2449485.1 tryptophan synthase subunit alpha [Actinomadura barringtoniae]